MRSDEYGDEAKDEAYNGTEIHNGAKLPTHDRQNERFELANVHFKNLLLDDTRKVKTAEKDGQKRAEQSADGALDDFAERRVAKTDPRQQGRGIPI